jgi:hypothetical protein
MAASVALQSKLMEGLLKSIPASDHPIPQLSIILTPPKATEIPRSDTGPDFLQGFKWALSQPCLA